MVEEYISQEIRSKNIDKRKSIENKKRNKAKSIDEQKAQNNLYNSKLY